jgi:acyl carrier protein
MSVRHRLSESLDVPEDEITVDTPLAEFADDSPRLVEYVMEIEEEFDLSLSEEEVQKIQTVGDVIRLIEARKRGSGG